MALGMLGWPVRWPWALLGASVEAAAAVPAAGGGFRGGRGADPAVSGRAGRLTGRRAVGTGGSGERWEGVEAS